MNEWAIYQQCNNLCTNMLFEWIWMHYFHNFEHISKHFQNSHRHAMCCSSPGVSSDELVIKSLCYSIQ